VLLGDFAVMHSPLFDTLLLFHGTDKKIVRKQHDKVNASLPDRAVDWRARLAVSDAAHPHQPATPTSTAWLRMTPASRIFP